MKGVGGGRFGPLASPFQTLDSSIHRINYYPADKYYRKQLWIEIHRVDSAIHRLNNRNLVNGI